MARYSKTYSNYTLKKKHLDTTGGELWWRDYTTTEDRFHFEKGKRKVYTDTNFLFTDNNIPNTKGRGISSSYIKSYLYDDVKDSVEQVNVVKINTKSNDIRDFAYYGSCSELVRSTVENIIKTFPGKMSNRSLNKYVRKIYDGSYITTNETIVNNPFQIDMYHQNIELGEYDNILRFMSGSWENYNIVLIDSVGNKYTQPIVSYTITDSTDETLEMFKKLGYKYVYYNGSYYVLDENSEKFIEIDSFKEVTNGFDYFIICDEYIKYKDKYYAWNYINGEYNEIKVAEWCDKEGMKIASIDIEVENGNASSNSYTFNVYYQSNTKTDTIITLDTVLDSGYYIDIQPNDSVITSYFDSLDGFEKQLLTRDTTPLYKNKFIIPTLNNNGFEVFTYDYFTWPSDDYCISIDTIAYDSYLNKLIETATELDNGYSDVMWRCMTHESIKNFDWSYRKDYNDILTDENYDGGVRMEKIVNVIGRTFDDLKRYIDGIKFTSIITYDGVNNVTDAEISDKNDIKGWDIQSTIWEPYIYEKIDSVPSGEDITYVTKIIDNANEKSPLYICVVEIDGNKTYYKKTTVNPIGIMLTNSVISTFAKKRPWIEDSENEVGRKIYSYKRIYQEPDMVNWNSGNTFNIEPTFASEISPKYVRVSSNSSQYQYYEKVSGYNCDNYLHKTWYGNNSINSITPYTTDIDFQRRLFLSTNRIMKSKGTYQSIDMIMGLFGFGRDGGDYNGNGDYSITEYYRYATPINENDIFYYYTQIDSLPSGVSFIDLTSLPTIVTEQDALYIRILIDSEYYTYYKKDSYINYNIASENITASNTEDGDGTNMPYSNVPIESFTYENKNYIIPFVRKDKDYTTDLYYQMKGGWEKKSIDNTIKYDYHETLSYLYVLTNVSELKRVLPIDCKDGDIYYVSDLTDYDEYSSTIPSTLSHFFKIVDSNTSYKFSSWRNIPMIGDITTDEKYNKDNVTHADYLMASYLNSIVSYNGMNDPHVGYGRYDMGFEYWEYLKEPYKYRLDNATFNDTITYEAAKHYCFDISGDIATNGDDDKVKIITNTVVDSEGNKTIEMSDMFQSTTYEDGSNTNTKLTYFLNSKLIKITNNINNNLYKKYFLNVILPYLIQVIPSTAILILENFNSNVETDNIAYYTIKGVAVNGNINGVGTFEYGSQITLSAQANDGYIFVKWSDGNTDIDRNITVVQDETYTAEFTKAFILNVGCGTPCLTTKIDFI